MMIPVRISDEILIAELPPSKLSISSKITIIFRCREQLISLFTLLINIYTYIIKYLGANSGIIDNFIIFEILMYLECHRCLLFRVDSMLF